MKKTVILMVLTLFSISTIYAQSKGKNGQYDPNKLTPEQKADKITEALTKKLILTDEQKPKVREFTLSKINKNIEIRQTFKADADKAKRKAAYEAANKAYEGQMKTVLTVAQYKKWIAARNKAKAKAKKAKKDGKPTEFNEEDADIENIEN